MIGRAVLLVVEGWIPADDDVDFHAPPDMPERRRSRGVLRALRIGTYFANPPFEYVANGQRAGFEVDLMNSIARRLSLDAVFVDTRWETILQEMENGLYDCIVGGITITPQRARILLWSTPCMTTTLSLVVDATRPPHLQSFADFKRATVGVQAAATDYDKATLACSGRLTTCWLR